MRILGIDYGDSRIGVAISDPMGWTAQAVETIKWDKDVTQPIKRIKELVQSYDVDRIIVGLPKNMNGSIGFRGEKTLEFIEEIGKYIEDKQIIKWDERLTTVSANRTMQELGVKTSKKKSVVDQIAAVYILQGYLDSIS